ncbi:MAG: GNAT family N-acetyltransferase [Terriglobales bacterium]
MTAPTLRTDRLLLRPFTRDDIPGLIPLIGAREVAATTRRIPHPYTLADAEEFIRARQQGDEISAAVVRQADLCLLGGGILRPDADHRHAELGYWIGVPHWGKGYATEAARALARYGFEVLQLHRIYASHTANNPASGTVLRKIGMKYEGRMRQHLVKWGEYLDLEFYGMLKGEAR